MDEQKKELHPQSLAVFVHEALEETKRGLSGTGFDVDKLTVEARTYPYVGNGVHIIVNTPSIGDKTDPGLFSVVKVELSKPAERKDG